MARTGSLRLFRCGRRHSKGSAVGLNNAFVSEGHKLLEIVAGIVFALVAYQVYLHQYFKGARFLLVRGGIARHTGDCNDLNQHVEDLKSTYADVKSTDYGRSDLSDTSHYNMRRRTWQEFGTSNRVHNCSGSVLKNASSQPFKYLCKYFDIKGDEETLSRFEHVLNNFAAAEQGKYLLENERNHIISMVDDNIPKIISAFSKKRLIRELGFRPIDLSNLYFPVYTFRYISAGGNSSAKCDIKLDIANLDKFIAYLSDVVKFRNSVAGQRALMTSSLREKIKQRDNYTCQGCRLSAHQVTNLLLEIDHIIPLARGGMTCESNLQTLCWKCNRTKGAKVLQA
ncbi:HNH endonuclease [Massilia sp. CCM 9210]|uniref:HNH endonuclease n=1 Tax=Massilia scottii TaxID=3057166 RepID=UPI002796A52B|nr:HNH endonuclease [Massilia sp. CCM 9210]MDQ1815675.1 HNH endonuclease [Massilia sp. CCM 9210]